MGKPAQVYNEPIATGWVRMELYGDVHEANNYIHRARKQLGAMKTFYGVNERIANGETGGFYHQKKMTEAGAVIETITNDGHDTIRITPPPPKPEERVVEKEDVEVLPYLWIGIEQTSNFPDRGQQGAEEGARLHVCLFEPVDYEPTRGDGVAECLSNRQRLIIKPYYNSDGWDESEAPIGHVQYIEVDTGDQYLPARIYHTNHSLYLIDKEDDFRAALSPVQMTPGAAGPLLYDTEAKDPENSVFSKIFVLDPEQVATIPLDPKTGFDGSEPHDGRAIMEDAVKRIKEKTGQDELDMIIPGKYILKVMSFADDCSDLPPTTARIVVRSGKKPYMREEEFNIEITKHTLLEKGALPYGFNGPSCPKFRGPNPHLEHWWQDAILMDPYGYIEKKEDYIPTDDAFNRGEVWPSQESICPGSDGKIIIFGFYASILVEYSPSQFVWPHTEKRSVQPNFQRQMEINVFGGQFNAWLARGQYTNFLALFAQQCSTVDILGHQRYKSIADDVIGVGDPVDLIITMSSTGTEEYFSGTGNTQDEIDQQRQAADKDFVTDGFANWVYFQKERMFVPVPANAYGTDGDYDMQGTTFSKKFMDMLRRYKREIYFHGGQIHSPTIDCE